MEVAMLRLSCRLPLTLVVSLVVMVFALAGNSYASASVRWCRSDPIVVIDGYVVDIQVSVPIDQLLKVTGATEIVIITPVGVEVALATPGVGFGYGEHVTFMESASKRVTGEGMEIRVKVLVPTSDDSVPVLLQVSPGIVGLLAPETNEGVANEWVAQRAVI
jgi:hypothetical protein